MKFRSPQSLALLLSLSAVGLQASPAQACGGFFCNGAAPVNQAAERIIFAQDGEKVVQIVEVLYEGDADKFAWVLPVPGVPEPGVSSTQALDRLQQATNPSYQVNDNLPESCNSNFADDGDTVAFSGGAPETAKDGGVQVLDSGSVGTFDYHTIAVDETATDPAAPAIAWLEDNGYDLGDRAGETLGPYLQNGMNLIAFKLQSGKETGTIRPIRLEYEAKATSIPIIPTSVAANDDMPIMVWVLGDSRAIPSNYKGLELNELLIDWFNPNDTYNAVVTAAANEAKGQGFVTEMAMPADAYVDTIHRDSETTGNYRGFAATDRDFIENLAYSFSSLDGFAEAVTETMTLREGVTPAEFASCVDCYFHPEYNFQPEGFGGAAGQTGEPISDSDPIWNTDPDAFAAAIEEHALAPLQETAALFEDHDYVTRFYTTMSAEEMTEDPTFKFNPDLDDVDNAHVAERDFRTCDQEEWVVTLPSGEKVYGKDRVWPHALDSSEMPANLRILQFSTSGEPEIVEDFSSQILSTHTGSEAGTRPVSWKSSGDGGCTVASEGGKQSPLTAWFLLAGVGLGGVAFARRRQS